MEGKEVKALPRAVFEECEKRLGVTPNSVLLLENNDGSHELQIQIAADKVKLDGWWIASAKEPPIGKRLTVKLNDSAIREAFYVQFPFGCAWIVEKDPMNRMVQATSFSLMQHKFIKFWKEEDEEVK